MVLAAFCLIRWQKFARIFQETEANAAAAERRTIDRFVAALFENRLGEIVDGVIVAITSFGAFVRIDDGAADGLLPLNACPMIFMITMTQLNV